MEQQKIRFLADDQQLKRLDPLRTFASDTINYICASFEFAGDAWSGYDNIFAVWYTATKQKSSEIIDGETIMPAEVLADPGALYMNLCANKERDGALVARMTSYPVNVLKLTKTNI